MSKITNKKNKSNEESFFVVYLSGMDCLEWSQHNNKKDVNEYVENLIKSGELGDITHDEITDYVHIFYGKKLKFKYKPSIIIE